MIDGYSKHLLADGNPRCLAFHLINKGDTVYALLEIDTSDNRNSLSTLLLKQPVSSVDWDRHVSEIEILLLKQSLAWPTSFLERVYADDYRRISHQKSSSGNRALLERESIDRWAERVLAAMLTC